MNFQDIINSITPDIYRNLQRAIETGKWPDGRILTAEQRELSMQAVIVYESKHIAEAERTGYIDRGSKSEGEVCGDDHDHDNERNRDNDSPENLKWMS